MAMSYRTEAEALRTKLAAKEKEVVRLSSELRELGLRLKDKMREESSHGEATCHKRCSTFAVLSVVVAFTKGPDCTDEMLPIAEKGVQVSRREELLQQDFDFLLVRPCHISVVTPQ